MKVLYIHGGGADIGGLDKYLINMIKAMIEVYTFEPYVVCSPSWPCQGTLKKLGVHIVPMYLPSWTKGKHVLFSVLFILRLLRLIQKNDIQIIHASGFYQAPFAYLAAKIARKPCVVGPLGVYMSERKPHLLSVYLLKNFDIVVALSNAAKNSLLRSGIKKERIDVSYHGVDLTYFNPKSMTRSDCRDALGISSEQLVLLVVANINPDKGQDILVHALHKVAQKTKRFLCVFVGHFSTEAITRNGKYYMQLCSLIQEYGLNSSVLFTGFVEDIRPYLVASDIFILPSRTEGLPIALLEAMAMGLPVVATRVGGIPEVVVDGETGILAPPNDPDQFAEALLLLLENRELRRRYGETGCKRVKSHFDIQLEAGRHLQIYQKLFNQVCS